MKSKISLQERQNTPSHTVFQMTVPRWICDALRWKKGTVLIVSRRGKFMRVCEEKEHNG